ncbi:hypothetical protein [Dactylosporangium sp. NPDC048998]|uniref:hypothetical protein n=1 Tax=Dactylosporangium sp. NPDC048998 TaxID=3363976 RepID=UPI003723A558
MVNAARWYATAVSSPFLDAIVDRLVAAAEADPNLDEHGDILALMLQARFDDGSAIPRAPSPTSY